MIRPLVLAALIAGLPAAAEEADTFRCATIRRGWPKRSRPATANRRRGLPGGAAFGAAFDRRGAELPRLRVELCRQRAAVARNGGVPQYEIQAAAIYALARLGPTAEDLPVLREALLSDSPGVRRAATGALKLIPDAAARGTRRSRRPMPSGSYFEPDLLPFDPGRHGHRRLAGGNALPALPASAQ